VGFLGAYRMPGGLDPVVAGILGACVTTWATFAPCFLWIFLGAPYIERLRGSPKLDAAMSAITAAVVGVILNLAVDVSLHTLFGEVNYLSAAGARIPAPSPGSIDLFALALACIAFLGLWRRGWGIVPVVLGSALAGLAWRLVTGGG
jgi:chromate transporter